MMEKTNEENSVATILHHAKFFLLIVELFTFSFASIIIGREYF